MARRKIDKNGICRWLLCVLLVLGALAVVCWLSVTPANPKFRITSVQFPTPNSMNTSAHDQNSTVTDNTLLVDLQFYNPNKRMGVYYHDIELVLFRDGGMIGMNSTPGFYQGYKKNDSVQSIMLHADEDFKVGVQYRIHVDSLVRFKIFSWKTKLKQINYDKISVMQPNNPQGSVSTGNSSQQPNNPHGSVSRGNSTQQPNNPHGSVSTGNSTQQPNNPHGSVSTGNSTQQQNTSMTT